MVTVGLSTGKIGYRSCALETIFLTSHPLDSRKKYETPFLHFNIIGHRSTSSGIFRSIWDHHLLLYEGGNQSQTVFDGL